MVAQRGFMPALAGQYWTRIFAGLLVIGIVAPVIAQAAEAQPYSEMPVDPPNIRGWDKARNCPQGHDPRLMLSGDADWNAGVFDTYFNFILFPQFTLYHDTDANGKEIGSNVLPMVTDPKDKTAKPYRSSKLPTCRQEFINNFVNQAQRNSNQEPFNHLNTLAIQKMRDIALGPYHPLSRYSAALLLGSLHEYQSEKPLKAALPALMACLDSIDVVRIAALDGVLKQAKAGNEGAQRPLLIAAMLKIVQEKTPPAGRSADGHDWIRRRAIDVLAAFGDAGPNMAVVAALDAILKDNQSSPELSCSAAKALGSISFHAPESMNASATAYSIGQIAVDAYKAELARAEQRHLAAVEEASNERGPNGLPVPVGGGGGGLLQPGGAAAAGAGAAAIPLFVSIPLLRSQLYALDRGMKGLVSAVAGTKDAQFADSVEKNLALLMASVDPNATDYDTLKTQIAKAGTGLEAALASGSAVQGRAPAPEKATAGGKEDSFDAEPEKPAAGPAKTAPAKTAPVK